MTLPTIAQVRLADQQRQRRLHLHNQRLCRQSEAQERRERVTDEVHEQWRNRHER